MRPLNVLVVGVAATACTARPPAPSPARSAPEPSVAQIASATPEPPPIAATAPATSSAPPSTARARVPGSVAATLDGTTDIEIVAPASVMDPKDQPLRPVDSDPTKRAEEDRRRLRDSVTDLARVLTALTGARANIVSNAPAATPRTYSIYVGAPAAQLFGKVGADAPFEQGFRVVVEARRAGLFGQSDLATSYAIYELLDRLGCRWFFPSELGEVLPARGPVGLPRLDVSLAPSTSYRGVWFADDAWKRRNRQGGLLLYANHVLETYVKKDVEQHPEWVATIGGKPTPGRIKWSSKPAADRIADILVEMHAGRQGWSYSLSPGDGSDFDDSPEDRALDAGDFDPTVGTVSVTDRFLVFANRVAARVAAKDPKVLLGFLAYGPMTRPPVRERVHPSLVPQIAPITYDRAHPMSDDRAPGNPELRREIEAWAAKVKQTSVYYYGWYLAAPVAPNPMLAKWGFDVPFVLSHGAKFWQPETLPTFESTLHALYAGMRLAFDSALKPEDIYADLDSRLYGNAAKQMSAYWQYVDRVWVDTPEYSGGPFGLARRFPSDRLKEMRRLLDVAKAAAKSDVERRRVAMADDSLALFTSEMKMRFDFIDGRFAGLGERAEAWKKRAKELGDQYAEQFAFGRVRYAPNSIYSDYFHLYEERPYVEAARFTKSGKVEKVIRNLRWKATAEPHPDLGPSAPAFDDSAWKTTDVALDSWSALGLHAWFHSVWYRAKLTSPGTKAAHRYLFLGGGDGAFRVFVNGREAQYVARPGSSPKPEGTTFFTFDVTSLLAGGENTIAILTTHTLLNELGVGGLMGPVVLYEE